MNVINRVIGEIEIDYMVDMAWDVQAPENTHDKGVMDQAPHSTNCCVTPSALQTLQTSCQEYDGRLT